jgi:hypothetical protein
MKTGGNAASAKSAMAYVVFLPRREPGQDLALAAQCGDEAVLDWHPHVESEIARRANRAHRVAGRLSGSVAFANHLGGQLADGSYWDRGTVLNRRADGRLKTAGRPRCQPTPHRRWSAGPARRPGSRRPDRGPCRRRLRVRGRKSGRRPAKRRMLRKIFSQPSAAAETRAGTTPLKQYWVSVSVARNGRPGFHILAAAMSCGVWVGAGTLAATSATKSSTASHHVVVVGSNQVMSAGGIAERAVR